MKKLALLLILPLNIYAFTLIGNAIVTFADAEIQVNVGDASCSELDDSPSEILDYVGEAIEKYWNNVPQSKLYLTQGVLENVDSTFYTEQICTSGNSNCTSPVPAVSSGILIVCNNNTSSDHGFPTTNVLAVTLPNNVTSSTINGAIIAINARSGTLWNSQDRNSKIAIIAHEIGHAFGLGHSQFIDSLMYSVNYQDRQYLGRDDYDGATFLYPKEHGAGALCGAVISGANGNKNGPIIGSFLLLMILFFSVNRSISYRNHK